MNEKEYQEFIKRYDKYKNNNLPTPFWDEERQTNEFVWFNDNELQVTNNLTYSLGEITHSGLYYPFIDKHLEGDSNNLTMVIGYNHAHNFEEVINALYNSPESFKIEKQDEKYYSKQELQFITSTQKYLLFIGLKDYNQEDKDRFHNIKQSKHINCRRITLAQETIDKIKNKELDFIAFKYCGYDLTPYEALILNEEGDYCLHVLVKEKYKIKYKDIKDKYTLKKIEDEDDVETNNIKILEVYL